MGLSQYRRRETVGRNEAAGCENTHTHIPADINRLAVLGREILQIFPSENIWGRRSDYEGAYQQESAWPPHADLAVEAQWNPETSLLAFFIAFAQVFGARHGGNELLTSSCHWLLANGVPHIGVH